MSEDAPVVERFIRCARCGQSTYGLEFTVSYRAKDGSGVGVPLCGKCAIAAINDALRRLDNQQRTEWILSLTQKEAL